MCKYPVGDGANRVLAGAFCNCVAVVVVLETGLLSGRPENLRRTTLCIWNGRSDHARDCRTWELNRFFMTRPPSFMFYIGRHRYAEIMVYTHSQEGNIRILLKKYLLVILTNGVRIWV